MEDKLISRTLETNGLAERFNWHACYKLLLNEEEWTGVSVCCYYLPLRKNAGQKMLSLNSAFDN